jgi:hypothetical protein
VVVPPITYQTLDVLLADLNALLWTPHDGRPFEFRGTCAVVSDPAAADNALLHAARVTRVARQLIESTALTFKYVIFIYAFFTKNNVCHSIHNLTVHSGAQAAFATTQSSAIWMGDPTPSSELLETGAAAEKSPSPCARCEHLLTIGVASARRAHVTGQSIVVALRHFAT